MKTALAFALLVVGARIAAAEPEAVHYTVGASGGAMLDRYLSTIASLEVGAKVSSSTWAELAVGTGSASGFDAGSPAQWDEHLFEIRVGARRVKCRGALCYGLGGGLGYQRERHMEADALIQDTPWEVRRHHAFAEVRGTVGAVMLQRVRLELALAPRFSYATVNRRAPRTEIGTVVSAGMLVQF